MERIISVVILVPSRVSELIFNGGDTSCLSLNIEHFAEMRSEMHDVEDPVEPVSSMGTQPRVRWIRT